MEIGRPPPAATEGSADMPPTPVSVTDRGAVWVSTQTRELDRFLRIEKVACSRDATEASSAPTEPQGVRDRALYTSYLSAMVTG